MKHAKLRASLGGPAAELHAAIDSGDWPGAERLLQLHGAAAGTVKNRSGSTPLMLAAGGKPGRKTYRLLVDALLACGCGSSAAERNHKKKTAADIAAARCVTPRVLSLLLLLLRAVCHADMVLTTWPAASFDPLRPSGGTRRWRTVCRRSSPPPPPPRCACGANTAEPSCARGRASLASSGTRFSAGRRPTRSYWSCSR
jgi:hypothetical protein